MATVQLSKKNNPLQHFFIYAFIGLVFLLNFLPTLNIGFYQDDFKSFLEPVQRADGQIFELLFKNTLGAGFRPLLFFDRIVFWEIFGENYVAHRIYLGIIHLLYGLLIYKVVALFVKDRFLSMLSVLFYFGMIFTRQTIYSSVAMNPADFFILFVFFVTVKSFIKGELSRINISMILFLYLLALLWKENGITILPMVFLIYFFDYKIIFKNKNVQFLLLGLLLLTGIYLYAYFYAISSMDINKRTISSSSLSLKPVFYVLNGSIQSFFAPFINLYRTLRIFYGASTIIAALSAGSLLLISLILGIRLLFGGRSKVTAGLKFALFFSLIILVILLPYVLNEYFENRMMVVSFALGVAFWSVILLKSVTQSKSRWAKWAIYSYSLLLIVPSIGLPITDERMKEYHSANQLRKLLKAEKFQSGEILCVNGFGNEVNMRTGNIKGLVKYETQNQIMVGECENIDSIITSHSHTSYYMLEASKGVQPDYTLKKIYLD